MRIYTKCATMKLCIQLCYACVWRTCSV